MKLTLEDAREIVTNDPMYRVPSALSLAASAARAGAREASCADFGVGV
jgi:hypothetical protein